MILQVSSLIFLVSFLFFSFLFFSFNTTVIKQRSASHFFIAEMDYELGTGPYPVQRYRTLFSTSLIPTGIPGIHNFWFVITVLRHI